MSGLAHDLWYALLAGVQRWRALRWMRKYGNPDECPF